MSICDATVRVMGALYRYHAGAPGLPAISWPDWDTARARLRNFVTVRSRERAWRASDAPRRLAGSLHRRRPRDLILDPRRLNVRLAVADDPVVALPIMPGEHLHSAGGVHELPR